MMASTPVKYILLGICLILLAVPLTVKYPLLAEAFPLQLQDCQTEDFELLIVSPDIIYSSDTHHKFFSELLDYFVSPDEVLRTRLKVAMVSAKLSDGDHQLLSLPSDNTTDTAVATLSDRIRLSFQAYNTTNDIDTQLNLIPTRNSPRLYVNGTFDSLHCNSYDLLKGLRQNSTSVGVVIVGHVISYGIEKIINEDSIYTGSCTVKMFLILGGHEIQDKMLHQNTEAKNYFYLPSLDADSRLPRSLCESCLAGKQSRFMKEEHCFFLYSSNSPISWFEASNQCEKREGQLVSVESKPELHFLRFIVSDYLEREYLENTGHIIPTVNTHYFTKVYIGLVRDTTITGSPFQWINEYPVTYTNWLNTLPDGGPNQRCGLWLFSRNMEWSESLGRAVYNVSDLVMIYNGWEDTGCGSRVASIALCELSSYENWLRPYFLDSLQATPANNDSFTKALFGGDFIIYNNDVISEPASVRHVPNFLYREKRRSLFKIFPCGDDNTIPYSYVCDHIEQCKFGEDEDICEYRTCDPDTICWDRRCYPDTEFTCRSGQCVPLESRCDVYTDCYDGSDEEDCQFCNSAMCCDGSCIPRNFVFNGEIDCLACDINENDESYRIDESTRDYDCPFICNRSECVTPSMLNDNITQCLGPEGPLDELWGKLETVDSCKISYEFNGSSVEFVRWSPRCVYIKDRYGTVIGCRDMSHLHDCQNFTCPEGYVKCPDSYCIPLHLFGDGHNDCPRGQDEVKGLIASCYHNFACWGDRVCVHPDLVCDGYPHCPSGDDELNCHVSCAEGFQCIGGTVTVTDFDKSKPLQDLSFIDKRTRYIDLSGINLSTIVNVGSDEQYRNVVELYLSNCQISHLDDNMTFKLFFTGVYVLDLSYNLISALKGNTMLTFMYNLRDLNLSHNKLLAVIANNAFQLFYEANSKYYPQGKDSNIENLNLAFTEVSVLDRYVLKILSKLKYLNLSHTHIRQVEEQSFPPDFDLATLDLRHTPLSNIEPNALTSLSVSADLYSDFYKLCCPQVRGQGIPEHVCHAPASAISSCIDLIQEPAQRVLLWTVGVLAVTGNLVVITYRLLWDRAVLKKSYGLFVTNLSVSDLFMGVYLLIIAGTDVIYRDNYVWYESDWRHSTLCQTAGFLSTLSSETSAFFILLVTLDRFLVIRFPFGHFRFTRWSIILSCVIAWSVGFVLALVPALPRFQHWQMYSSNGMCLGLPLTPDRRSGWEYSAALFIGLNFILFLFIACGQYLIYIAMSENSLKTSSAVQSNAKRVQEIMVAKQLSLVVLSDFLCWFPIGIMGLLAMSGRDIGTEVYAWSAVLVLPINSALNPVLYTVPVIMKKWEDFKYGNSKSKTEMTKSIKSKESTKDSRYTSEKQRKTFQDME